MKHSGVVTIVLVGILVLISGLAVWDGAFLKTAYDVSKDKYDEEKGQMTETEFKLIQAGIQSASSHNMQPWKIKIVDASSFILYADKSKALKVIDPENKQMLISQGTFIGAVKEAAKAGGVSLEVTYNSIQMTEEMPQIATFKIVSGEMDDVDGLSAATSNVKSKVSEIKIDELESQSPKSMLSYGVTWIKKEDRLAFQAYLRKGTRIGKSRSDGRAPQNF